MHRKGCRRFWKSARPVGWESSRQDELHTDMKASLVLVFAIVATAADGPPNPYIDLGACPFECCLYREWRATKPLMLMDQPHGTRVVGRLRAGERVNAITGQTQSVPLAMQSPIDVPEAGIRAGDQIFLLHYEGEGFWAVWFRGKVADAELGQVKRVPKSEWWAKVRTTRGVVGWVRAENNFQNQDGCG